MAALSAGARLVGWNERSRFRPQSIFEDRPDNGRAARCRTLLCLRLLWRADPNRDSRQCPQDRPKRFRSGLCAFLIAMTLLHQGGDYGRLGRVPEEFEAAIKLGKATDWYDDALYHY